ncbi:MAG: hypothetical protein NTW21_37620 [Verrucomicrobia bacterium]|nr:hypothetical protein [Verrucomicrobiota bacterium]
MSVVANVPREALFISPFLIPAENELALAGVSDEFVHHPRMGFRVAEVPMRCHLLLLRDH